jgi:hypothetical protein
MEKNNEEKRVSGVYSTYNDDSGLNDGWILLLSIVFVVLFALISSLF